MGMVIWGILLWLWMPFTSSHDQLTTVKNLWCVDCDVFVLSVLWSSFYCNFESSPCSWDKCSTDFGQSQLAWVTDPSIGSYSVYIHHHHLLPPESLLATHFTIPQWGEDRVDLVANYVTNWFTCQQIVTHPSTNWAWHRVTVDTIQYSFIKTSVRMQSTQLRCKLKIIKILKCLYTTQSYKNIFSKSFCTIVY